MSPLVMESANEAIQHNETLSDIYSQGIERCIGTTHISESTFILPPMIIQKRKNYWYQFFNKYSTDVSDEISQSANIIKRVRSELQEHYKDRDTEEYSLLREPVRKPMTHVQYWVNTGTLPRYDHLVNEESPVVQPSLNERDLLNQTPFIKTARKPARRSWRRISDDSSSSSVNTVAYILSNAQTTKKAEATAIVEGSKLKKNMGSQLTTPTVEPCSTVESGKDNTQTSDEVVQDKDSKPIENSLQQETEKPAIDVVRESSPPIASVAECNTLHNNILTPDSNSADDHTIHASQNMTQIIEQAIKCLTNKNMMTPSQSERDSTERDIPALIDEEVSTLDNHNAYNGTETSKIHRKKLYSGRDSPVDLVDIQSSLGSRLSQSTQNLHPALDPVNSTVRKSLLKKRKLKANKRKLKWSLLIAKASMNNTAAENETGLNSLVNGLTEDLKKTTSQFKTPAKKRTRTKSCLDKVRKFTPKRSPFRRKVVAHNIEPTVCVRRLSDKIVEKYMQKSPMPSLRMNPVVQLERLSESFIQRQTVRKNVEQSVRKNVARSKKSLKFAAQKERNSTNDVKNKSARPLLPLDAQYVDSDAISNSSSTILVVNCTDDNSKDPSDSSVMDNSSQDLLYKVHNSMPNGKCVENGIAKDLQSMPTNNIFNKLRQRNNSKVNTVGTSPLKKFEKLRRSGKFEVIKNEDTRTPLVVLDKLTDDDLSSCRSSTASERKLQAHKVVDNLESECSSQDTPKRPRSARGNLRSQTKADDAPTIRKSSERLVFETILEPEICSDYSGHSKVSTSAKQKRKSIRNHSLISNKRSRGVLLTLSSDEDDSDSFLAKLPSQKVKSQLNSSKRAHGALTLSLQSSHTMQESLRLVHTMVIQSDDEESDGGKKVKRKATQSKRRTTQTSVVSIADSTTVEEGEKSVQSSTGVDRSPKKVIKKRGRKSKHLANDETEKPCAEDTIKKNCRVSCTEPDANHVTSTSIEEKVSTPKFSRSDKVRNRAMKNR